MGTLDDAIRQHLDLKRRRGATDSELQRLEDEAFGPPSRPGEPDFPEHETGSAEQSGNGAVADVSAEPDEHEAAEAQTTIYAEPEAAEPELGELDLELEDEGAPAQEPVPSEEPPDAAASEPPIEGLDTVEHEMPDQELEPDEERGPSEHEPEAEAEEEAPEAPESGQQDDMLADTPDFLKDAPEDDELWFEQGKPKDFDF
jgi:hypothetical protein